MPISLTVIEGPHQGQVFTFAGQETFVVGRSNKAHFRLPHKDKYFSRVHFVLEVKPPHCRLVDMGSRNGTYVNGQKVTAAVDLKDGDLITAGHSVLRVSGCR
jgi:pSer/pThr/pTyr-binding forkhead associated (FHA) protein